jgi:nucleotide-binding universal stress UspA family protein
MKILVAVDGSAQCLAAVAGLADHVRWFRDPPQLTLIHAHLPIPYKAAAAWAGHEAVAKYYSDESDAALEGAAKLLGARGLAFAVEKCVGDPAEEIVRHAAAGGYDMIAMGTHGHTGLANLVMGSVATKVLARTRVPVIFMKS